MTFVGSSEFSLHSTAVLWTSLLSCWSDDVYLDLLCNRFWKLNLQLLSRYTHWLDECYETEVSCTMDQVSTCSTKRQCAVVKVKQSWCRFLLIRSWGLSWRITHFIFSLILTFQLYIPFVQVRSRSKLKSDQETDIKVLSIDAWKSWREA